MAEQVDPRETRDDRGLANFRSRSQQPRMMAHPQLRRGTPSPVNIYVVMDSGLGGPMSQTDVGDYAYVGTSVNPGMSQRDASRRIFTESMKSVFQ